MSLCPHCQQALPETPTTFCPSCGKPLATPSPRTGSPQAGTYQTGRSETGSPWEGAGGGFFEATKEILFSPGEFFDSMPVSGGIGRPLLYAIIAGTIATWFSAAYNLAIHFATGGGGLFGRDNPILAYTGSGFTVLQCILAPVIVILGVFFLSALYHLLLLLFGHANQPFEATLRVVCYGYAPCLFAIVPLCGSLVGLFWTLAVLVIGLSRVHRIGIGLAIVVVLLPMVVCGCGFGVFVFLLMRSAMGHW